MKLQCTERHIPPSYTHAAPVKTMQAKLEKNDVEVTKGHPVKL